MSEEHRETWLDWLDRLRGWAPMGATLFGLLYAAGFVIVNAYLGAYGVRELEAVRTRYVGAGLVFLGYCGLMGFGSGILERSTRALPLRLLIGLVGQSIVSAIELLVLWRANSGPLGDQPLPETFGLRLAIALLITNLSLMLLASGFRVLRRMPRRRFVLQARGVFAWVASLGLAGVVVAYAAYIYPAIPAYLGGGVPSRVRLVVSPAVVEICPPCGREEMLLIYEDSHRWVVLVRDASGREVAVEIFLLANADRVIVHAR